MFISKGIRNNRDPSTIYQTVEDVERFFSETVLRGGEVLNIPRAANLSPVAAAHRIFTNSIGIMPWQIRRKEDNIRTEPAHYLDYVLKIRANAVMSPFLAEKIIASQAFWHGVGFAYIGRNGEGKVTEIIPLPSEGYQRAVDPNSGAVWYSFSVDDSQPGAPKLRRKFQPSELLIFFFETYDGWRGQGMLNLAKEAMTTDYAAQRYGGKFYKNGARVSGIVEVTSELNEDNRETVRRDFEHMAHGMDNAFRVAVLDMGMKYTPLGISQKDSQFIEGRGFAVEEVSRFSGIPIYMLQSGKQSYQSNEQQQLDFVTNTLMAHIRQIEQEWAFKLYRRQELTDGFYLRKNAAALLRGDNKTRSEFYQKMISNGIYSPDDCRTFEDMSPLPDNLGETYWMSKNYDTIKNIAKGGNK